MSGITPLTQEHPLQLEPMVVAVVVVLVWVCVEPSFVTGGVLGVLRGSQPLGLRYSSDHESVANLCGCGIVLGVCGAGHL